VNQVSERDLGAAVTLPAGDSKSTLIEADDDLDTVRLTRGLPEAPDRYLRAALGD
jgi:hypothetical protein